MRRSITDKCSGRKGIADILPHRAISSEAHGDLKDAAIFPEEAAIVALASEPRRLAFTTARTCAHRALCGLGVDPVAITADARGAPRWPTGIVGSITHCVGYRAAAVARNDMLLGIGIDAERNLRLSCRVVERIASEAEREVVCELLCTHPQIAWDRLLFSAKEAAYKACYPLGQRSQNFSDVLVELDPAGDFEATLSCVESKVTGRWLLSDDLLITAGAIAQNPMPGAVPVSRICPWHGEEG